eukprot:s5328_g7.t1
MDRRQRCDIISRPNTRLENRNFIFTTLQARPDCWRRAMPPGSEDFPPLGGFPPLGPISKSKAKGAGKSKASSEPPPGELSQAAPPKKAPAPPPKKASPEVLPKAPPKAAVEAVAVQPLSKKAAAAQAPPKAPAEAASASAEAPQRFGAFDYERAAEADAAANAATIDAAETEDRLNLDIPPLALGKKGVKPLRLVSNHFYLSVRSSGNATVWRCWRVDFVKMDKDKDPNAKKMPKKKGEDEREVPKGVRKLAVEELLKDIPHTDWLHDGNNLLYTRKTVTALQDLRKEVEVPPTKPGGRPFPLTLEVKFEDRWIDLGWLHQPQVNKDPAEAMASMSEHRRFVQVAIRTLAQEREELIAQGRKVICADRRLICDAVPLKYGREMWFGYIGQVEIVNGGPGVGGRLNPARATLSLNLVASVGLPDMWVIDLLGKLGAKKPGERWSEDECKKDVVWNYWDRRYQTLRDSLRGELGLRKLRVRAEYGQVKVKGKLIYGLTDKPANRYQFDCEEMGGKVDVAAYFKHKHGLTLQYPDLPCVQLGNARNCIPMEYIYVMGGEHNLAVGKLRPEFQQEVTRRTAMPPSTRRDQIMQALNNAQLGPSAALNPKGIDVAFEMLAVTGRQLETPKLRDGRPACKFGVTLDMSSEELLVDYSVIEKILRNLEKGYSCGKDLFLAQAMKTMTTYWRLSGSHPFPFQSVCAKPQVKRMPRMPRPVTLVAAKATPKSMPKPSSKPGLYAATSSEPSPWELVEDEQVDSEQQVEHDQVDPEQIVELDELEEPGEEPQEQAHDMHTRLVLTPGLSLSVRTKSVTESFVKVS